MDPREPRRSQGCGLTAVTLPAEVSIYEVGPRDGLQNEAAILSTDDKLCLIAALAAAGLTRIEAGSFVSPKWIPPLADSAEVLRRLPVLPGVRYSALVPNERGLQAALQAGVTEIAVFLSASETHNRKNVNKGIDETLRAFEAVVPPAVQAGLRVRGYVSTVWGCPYEGAVDPARALQIGARLLELGCYELSLGDTIGVGTPLQTARICALFLAKLPQEKIALHLHDTHGTALANVLVGLQHGITTFDASVGGLGGCPYAPGASGNLATEDLVWMLDGMGIRHGVSLQKLVQAGALAQERIGRTLPGRTLRAELAGSTAS